MTPREPRGDQQSATRAHYVGVDLAADPARTGLAMIREEPDRNVVIVENVTLGVSDDDLIDEITAAEKTGVDVPFGWPRPFVERLVEHSAGVMAPPADTGLEWRRSMAMRRTDLVVRERFGLVPLSVATDRIAYPALRWSGVEARLRGIGIDCPRNGAGRVCEVYPAAALRSWGLPHRGYKRDVARDVREHLVEALEETMPWLVWNGFRGEAIRSDDILDAVIAALVAREVAAGRTLTPAAGDADLALSEGWIHVPVTASLGW